MPTDLKALRSGGAGTGCGLQSAADPVDGAGSLLAESCGAKDFSDPGEKFLEQGISGWHEDGLISFPDAL
jgi:hypothetical protein